MANFSIKTIRTWFPVTLLAVLLTYKVRLFLNFAELMLPPQLYWLNIPGIIFILWSPLLLIKNNRRRFITALTMYAFFSFVIVVQLIYLRYYTRPFSIHVLFMLGNLQGLGPSIWTLISFRDIVLLTDSIFMAFFLTRIPAASTEPRSGRQSAMIAAAGILMVLIAPLRDKFIYDRDLINIWREEVNLSNYNAVGYFFFDIAITLSSRLNEKLTPGELKSVESWFKKNKKNNPTLSQDPLFASGKGKNLILIQCEALADFAVKRVYKGKEVTPTLNRFIDESLYFSRYHCQNFHGGSSDAEFVLLTSLLPPLKGSTFFRFPHNQYLTLPKLLKRRGYRTLAIHGNQSSFWNRGETYPSMGIDVFYDSLKLFGKNQWVNDDRGAFEKAIKILIKEKQPFFGIIITIETHLGGDLTNVGGYLRAIEKLDENLNYLLGELKKSGIYDNSVIALYGDHPPYLDYEKIKTSKKEYSWIIKPGREIPMVIHIPGVRGQTINKVTAHADGFPALAHIMGIEPKEYAGSIMGKNPFAPGKGWAQVYPDEYISDETNTSLEELSQRKRGFHISDMIIRSNFFKRYR